MVFIMANRRGGFKKGHAKIPGSGRKAGTANVATREGRAMALSLVEDPAYLKSLKTRMISGTLPPAVECMVWAYAYGKPPDKLVVEGQRRPLIFLSQYPLGYDPLAGAKTVGGGDTAKRLPAAHVGSGEPEEPADRDDEPLVVVKLPLS